MRPCTDEHYPEQAVKIILLQHSIRKLKRQQKVLRPPLPCSSAGEQGEGRRGMQ